MENHAKVCENTFDTKKSMKARLRSLAYSMTIPALLSVPAVLGGSTSALAVNVKPDTASLTNKIDQAGGSFISIAQSIAVVVMVVFIIIIAYTLFVKKSADSLADLKGKLLGLVLAVIFVFFPEEVIGAFLGLFGASVSTVFWFL